MHAHCSSPARLLLVAAATLVAAGVVAPHVARGQTPVGGPPSGASVYISPGGSSIFTGGLPETLSETVAGVPYDPGLGSFQLDLAFDPGTIDVFVSEGPFLKSTGRATSCGFNAITEMSVIYGCSSTGSQRGASGQGVLALFDVSPAPGLNLKPTLSNGRLGVIDNVRGGTTLFDTEDNLIPIGQLLDALINVRALEGDINGDCKVDISDEQLISEHYGTFLGSLLYITFFDLEPAPNGDYDIDIKDLQFVFGRDHTNCKTPQPTPGTTETPIVPTVEAFTRTPTATRTATPTGTPAVATATTTTSPPATGTPATATASPTSTATPATASPTSTGTPATATATSTAHVAAGTATPTRPASTNTPGAGTPTRAASGTPSAQTPAPTLTPVNTVLANDRPRPRGLPGTGQGSGLTASDWGWLLAFITISVGVLSSVILRNVARDGRP